MNNRRKVNKAVLSDLIDISKNVQAKSGEKTKYKKILFCPLNATEINTIRETTFALALKARGIESKLLYLDTNLEKSEFYSTKKEYLIYKYKIKGNIGACEKMGLDVVRTSDYNKNLKKVQGLEKLSGEELENYTYKGVFLGDLITASSVRTMLSNGPEWENTVFRNTAIQNARSATLLVDIYSNILEKERPNKLVMTHGIYISWGPLFRLARKMDIPVDVYGSSYRKNTVRFYHNAPNAPFPEAEWPNFKNVALNDKELSIVEDYIASREDQNQDNVSTLFKDAVPASPDLQDFIAKNDEKKIFCMFTNIAWDAFAFSSEGKFSDMFDWIEQTISFFKKSNKSALILKAHPAEDHWNTPEKYRVKTLIKKIGLSENIYFISETEKLKPFWLYEKIDWGIIHISTVGLEMALKEIPVISSGAGSHYSHNGFTIDPVDSKDYFEKLEQIENDEINFAPDTDIAKRYMYYRFFREAIPSEIMLVKDFRRVDEFNIRSEKDLLPGKFKSLDIILDGILNDSPFVYC
ncbi:MAG: glycosyltransferase [Crocinitomicaceae bacterium]|nr:glycosyltransferase [Crocinitomicaceae bacterium]